MNYPESALITGLITAINTKLPLRTVYTIPPKDSPYPYIYLSQTDMQEIGSKAGFIYRFEPLIQVIHSNLSSLSDLLSDMQEIHEIITNGADITVSGYTVIEMNLIMTNRTTELYDWGRLDIGLIRTRIDLE
jgi:hypothetical protein